MSGDLEHWVKQLETLIGEARAAGMAPELAPILARLARELEPVAQGEADGAADAPSRRFGMVGDSPAMHELFDLLERVASSDVPVLVQGETGTGKELVARGLHEHGPRKSERFLAENCAAVPANLLESELFGHKKGAFTGAVNDRPGHFLAADGGTVFLDEIGDMPLEMQAKLLRVLQDGEVRPVGSNKSQKVDVRIVAATNKDLPDLCRKGEFREDLYYRLAVVTVQLPALRERAGDVPLLARFFLAGFAREQGRTASFTPAALEALEAYSWPGNVRELENEVQRALALSTGDIGPSDLSPRVIRP